MRILLIEDDPSIAQAIEAMLRVADMNVYSTDLGEEGLDLAKLYDYDLILLDLNLPDISGLEVARRLRDSKCATPILILTSVADVPTKLKAFGYGADDYVIKPCHQDELIARIRAIVRRAEGNAEDALTIGSLKIDMRLKTASVSGQRVHLTGKEYAILEALARRIGVTMTKENLVSQIYGGMDEPELKIVDVFICKLRAKLRAAGVDGLIETIWGRGYTMRDPGESVASESAAGVAA